MLYYIILYYIILYYIILYYIILYYIIFYFILFYFILLYYIILYQYYTSYYIILYQYYILIITVGMYYTVDSYPTDAGTFNRPTSNQKWVWEREANITWSMVTCQGSIRLELP